MPNYKVVDAGRLDAAMTATADAIREKTSGTDPIPWNADTGFAEAVAGITGGGAAVPVPMKDVNFYDYDGTRLYSYTVEEAAALTEMPPLPTQPGLICQGWNWTLADIKSTGKPVDVGAMYITDDGKTRIYITLTEGRTSPMLGVCPNGTVTVDWGDGTEPDVLTGTSDNTVSWTPSHTYPSSGDYVITMTVDGTMGFYGSSTPKQGLAVLKYSKYADGRNIVYQNSVKKIEIGNGVTSIGNQAFYDCSSLSRIIIPNGVTSIGNNEFYDCRAMTRVIIPDSITHITESAFRDCSSLSHIIIPNGASIGARAFYNNYGVRYYDFTRHTAVPSLSNINAFEGISADCEIRVPAALADKWKAATNWVTYADYIVGV